MKAIQFAYINSKFGFINTETKFLRALEIKAVNYLKFNRVSAKINLKIIMSVFSFFIATAVQAQKERVSGNAYRNAQFYHDDKLLCRADFVFKKKDQKIKNTYKLKSSNGIARKADFKYGIWIVDCENYFYLNVYRFGYGFPQCYVKFEKKGNYYYFNVPPVLSASQRSRIANSQLIFGVIGSGITATKILNHNADRSHNVFDLERGTVQTLTVEYLNDIISDYPELYESFSKEKDKEKLKTLKSYLEKINEQN